MSPRPQWRGLHPLIYTVEISPFRFASVEMTSFSFYTVEISPFRFASVEMTFYVCHLDLLFNVIDARTRRICLLAMPSLRSLRAQSRNLIRFLLSPRVTIQCHLDRSGEVSIRLYILLRFLHFASLQSK